MTEQPTPSHILLIGLRGSGKTTVGKLLAERLSWGWVDLDEVTVRLLGCSTVSAAWNAVGEPGFRDAEARALAQVCAKRDPPIVVALGGGTPTAPGAATEILSQRDRYHAACVYLRAPAAVLRERLRRDDNSDRPPLTGAGADVLGEMEAVLARRDSLYRQLASCVVETDGLTVQEVVDRIVQLVR